MITYLGALLVAMVVIVIYLVSLALVQGSAQWMDLAWPFIAETVVIFATRTLLDRGHVQMATLTFVWGSVAAIIPFVVLFPAAYPASVVAVAQVEAIGLAYLRGRALAATLLGMTVAAGVVTAIGNALGSSAGPIEKVSVTLIVLLSFGLLSMILALNQARLTRAVQEAERARDSLEEKVEERTANLTRVTQELRQANVLAQEATRAKSEFLANMSHELRTPLNAVLGFCDLLVEQLGPQVSSAQHRYFQNIKDAGNHLLQLINEVLDLSKVEAGRLELRPEPIQLPALFEPVLASARQEAAARGLSFEAAVPSDTVVGVDPGRMRQVLYNLVSNAVKFTPPGGRVEVRMSTEGRDLLLEVADTGIGIPMDKRGRVFGTFERLHEGRSDATGTGLGLALTKKLVELHRGAIAFDSEEGRGTTFRIRIPEAIFAPVTGPRLLIVEDDRRDAELLAALAGQLGVAAEVVGTARAARAAVQRDRPAGIVLDLRLPDERGERILEELKGDPATRGIPILVVTVEDDEGRSRPLGADDHLTKPIDHERVISWISSRVAVPRSRETE